MGRLWQTLILAKWREVFINIPVESLVYQHQVHYYQAINQSTKKTDCAAFVEFMLQMIWDAINESRSFGDGTNDGTNDGINKGVKLSVLDKKIIGLLKADNYITNVLIASKLKKSIRTIERRIKYLKDHHIVNRLGAKKSGKWVVVDH